MGSAIGLSEDDVTTLRAKRHLDCISEGIDATLEALTSFYIELDFFCHDYWLFLK